MKNFRQEMNAKFSSEILKRRHYLWNLPIEGKIAIKLILKRHGCCLKMFNGFISLKILANEHSGPTRGTELPDRLIDSYVLKKYSGVVLANFRAN